MSIFLVFYILLLGSDISGQKIRGEFPAHSGQQIQLKGFEGFGTYSIAEGRADAYGNFELNYSRDDFGVGVLMSGKDHRFIVILSGEDIYLSGEALGFTESIEVVEGMENRQFAQFAREQPLRENALSAWFFLKNVYNSDSLFLVQKKTRRDIEDEIKRLRDEERQFLQNLPPESYVRWFLPLRKLVSTVGTIAQHRPQEIPEAYTAFRNLDYADTRLYKSGLLKEAVENHFWLIENSAGPLDSVFAEMKTSIDIMLDFLIFDEKRLNEISNHLFNYLESRSLFTASEYLAISLLNQETCVLEENLARQLESYRAMKVGNKAPDIEFGEFTHFPGEVGVSKLSDLDFDYSLIVFAAGWCPYCMKEIPEIAAKYSKWREYGVEVVLVSLDETPQEFSRLTSDLPFIRTTDYKKWDSPIIADYYVFGVPSMFLLNRKREIVMRINSARHMNAWVDWNLIR